MSRGRQLAITALLVILATGLAVAAFYATNRMVAVCRCGNRPALR